MISQFNHTNKFVITRVTVAITLLFLLWRYFSGLSVFSLSNAALHKIDTDFVYWVLDGIGFFSIVTNNSIASLIFTIVLFVNGLWVFVFPNSNKVAFCYALIYLLYGCIINFYACHPIHYLAGFSVLLFVFTAKSTTKFGVNWELARYYACFVYSMVFFLKVYNGVFFSWDSGFEYFKINIAEYLYHNQTGFWASFYYWFLQHPYIVNLFSKVVFLLEGAFFIGFFTKKFDAFLSLCALLIFLSIYLFIDVFFIELLFAICLPLFKLQFWQNKILVTLFGWEIKINKGIHSKNPIKKIPPVS